MESSTALETALAYFTPANIAYTAMGALGGWLILATLLWALVHARGHGWEVFQRALVAFSIGAACLLTIVAAPIGLFFLGKAVWIGYRGDSPKGGAAVAGARP